MDNIKNSIENFVARLTEESNADLMKWLDKTEADVAEGAYDPRKVFTISYGRKYAKVITNDANGSGGSVWGFIDIATGNILKAAGWSKPAKHARGHIDTAVYGRNYQWTGPAYL
jgi:hypothetical protein